MLTVHSMPDYGELPRPVVRVSGRPGWELRRNARICMPPELATATRWVYLRYLKYAYSPEGLVPWHRRFRYFSSTILTAARRSRPYRLVLTATPLRSTLVPPTPTSSANSWPPTLSRLAT